MKSLLVALMVHLLNDPAGLMGATMPFYVVPAKPFGDVVNGLPLSLTTSDVFGEPERTKWLAVQRVVGKRELVAEFCYRAAYADIKHGLGGMKVPEAENFIVATGGYHMLARASVRVCNASLEKLDTVPPLLMKLGGLTHKEYAPAERSLREEAYQDDIAFLKSCRGEACAKAPAVFARGVVGVGLEGAN